MANALATIPGIVLYRDGIRYEFKQGCLGRWTSLTPSQEGFAPIEHVSAIEIAEIRDLGFFIFSVLLIPVIIGVILLVFWIGSPQLVVRVHSDGEVFATVIISKSHRADAEELINTYRKLKYAISPKATTSKIA